jgi:hypothetical protein
VFGVDEGLLCLVQRELVYGQVYGF